MADAHIIVGMGYGNEGKGVFTDYLCSKLENPIVIRFNGGSHGGHKVAMRDGRAHVFSSFGSGAFRKVPTFISSFCAVNPAGILAEYEALQGKNVTPELLVDNLAMVVTPFDQFYNDLQTEKNTGCLPDGGFSACMERNLASCNLYAQDLQFPRVTIRKLVAIRNFYLSRLKQSGDTDSTAQMSEISIRTFLDQARRAALIYRLVSEREIFSGMQFTSFIFEGAQGILLDKDFGIFPNRTKYNTTSCNAFAMLRRNFSNFRAEVYYLTRAYQSRPGYGWMSTRSYPISLVNDDMLIESHAVPDSHETGVLDLDMLNYALQCDLEFAQQCKKNLVISCLDQLGEYRHLHDGRIVKSPDLGSFVYKIAVCDSVYLNNSPFSDTFRHYSWSG